MNGNNKTYFLKRIIVIITGSVIAAFGITRAIYSGYGGATLAILWQGISNVIHVSVGVSSLIAAGLMILFSYFYDRSQIHIGTIIYQIVYSGFVEIFSRFQRKTDIWYVDILLMLAGVLIFASGTGLYASSNLGRGSYEAVTFALADKNHWQPKYVRAVLDVAVVLLGMLMGGKFGLCTIATIIISGPVIQLSKKKSEKLFNFDCGVSKKP